MSLQSDASASFMGPIAQTLQLPAARWILLVGLGTSSVLLASRYTPFTLRAPRSPRQKEAAPTPPKSPPPPQSKKDRQKEDSEHVAIFWDVDNCAPPTGSSGRSVALAIRSSIQKLNAGPIVSFKAYLELSSETLLPNAAQVQLRSELQGCGVSLIDTPKSGRKDVADKMMITDLLAFAIDQPAPATIVLISGDRDFAYPLGILRNRGYEVVLIVPPIGAVPILEASANVVMSWRQDVLGVERNAAGKPYSSYSHQGPSTPVKSGPQSTHPAPTASTADKTSFGARRLDRRPSIRTMEIFGSLISLLEQLRSEGQKKPLRSHVAARLVSIDRNVFTRAGATRWAEFAAVAEAANIVTLGSAGGPGTEWVALKDISLSTIKPSVDLNALPSTPNRGKSLVQPSSAPAKGVPVDLRPFVPLIEICKELTAQGNAKPLCSTVAAQIAILERKGKVDTYAMAKVSNWTEYIAAAERAGVARLAQTNHAGVYAVALHPKYLHSSGTSRTADSDPHLGSGNANQNTTPDRTTNTGSNVASTESTPTTPAKRTVVVNGHEIPQIFYPLANLLIEQMAEGRNFSTDYFCHSIVGSQRSPNAKAEVLARTEEDFRQYVEAAVICKIITTEPGYKPGVRHIRLHPRLVRAGPKVDPAENGIEPQTERDSSQSTSATASRDFDTAPTLSKEERAAKMEALKRETGKALESLTQSASSEDSTASGQVPTEGRFAPLADSLYTIFKQAAEDDAKWTAISAGVTKTKLSAEMAKRHTGPGGLGVFYQSLGSTGFTDYLTQAKDRGLVIVTDKEGNVVPKGTSLMGLTEYTITL